MSKYVDINLITKEYMFLETYSMINNYLKNVVNSNDIEYVEFLQFELDLQIKYFFKQKIKLLNRKDDSNERV